MENKPIAMYWRHLRFIQIFRKSRYIYSKMKSDLLQNLQSSWRLGSQYNLPIHFIVEYVYTLNLVIPNREESLFEQGVYKVDDRSVINIVYSLKADDRIDRKSVV